jgi:hypothetical protein
MKYTVILNAPPNAGKDVAAIHMSNTLGYNHLEFKDALRDAVCEQAGISRELLDELSTRENKDKVHDVFKIEGKSVTTRQYYIYISEEVYKPLFGKSYFGDKSASKIVDGVNIFSDGGFIEELQPVIECSDVLLFIRIHRDGCTFEGDSRRYISDDEIEGIKSDCNKYGADFINDYPTVEEYLTEIKSVVTNIIRFDIFRRGVRKYDIR